MDLMREQSLQDKLHILADATKYDVACTSSGVDREGKQGYLQIYRSAMSWEADRLDAIYRFMLLGFAYGKPVTKMLTESSVMRIIELSRKVSNEARRNPRCQRNMMPMWYRKHTLEFY